MTKNRAAIYVRLSDDKKKTGENVADQIEGCRAVAKSLDREVPAGYVYDDNNRPASDPENKPRPEFLRLLADAESGKFDVVIVRTMDRLYRHPIDLQAISATLAPKNIVIHQEWQSGFPIDLTTPTGLLQAGIAAQVALYEIGIKKQRQAAATERLLKKGALSGSGPRPFGFDRDDEGLLVPHPTEAERVLSATRCVLKGGSIGSLVRQWNAEGVPATRGGEWGYTSMRALLTRMSNAGIRQQTVPDPDDPTKKVVVESGPGNWAPIVPEEEFRALMSILNDPSRIKHRGLTARVHLLSHIIKCGKCGSPMRAASTKTQAGKVHPTYQCPGQKTSCRLSIDYEVAEAVVTAEVAKRIAVPEASLLAFTAEDRGAVTDLHKRLQEIDGDEREVEDGGASMKSKQRQLADLDQEREAIAAQLAAIARRDALADLMHGLQPVFAQGKHASIEAAINARAEAAKRFARIEDLDHRRAIIRALVRVEVLPATKGIRPTKETARQRVIVTPLDPKSGEPIKDDEVAA